MYIHTQIMAKTIMIANDTYKELKELKEDKSFSELIRELIKNGRTPKTVNNLKKHLGTLPKDDTEFEEAIKELKPLYTKWKKKYV